jgi:hypothetical protein
LNCRYYPSKDTLSVSFNSECTNVADPAKTIR